MIDIIIMQIKLHKQDIKALYIVQLKLSTRSSSRLIRSPYPRNRTTHIFYSLFSAPLRLGCIATGANSAATHPVPLVHNRRRCEKHDTSSDASQEARWMSPWKTHTKEAKLHVRQCPSSCVFQVKFPTLSCNAIPNAEYGRDKRDAPAREI